jgi:glutamyl-tRNA reductase
VDLAREIFTDLKGHTVVLVGTGEMAGLVATLLGKAGARVLVVGRTAERAREVAQKLGAEPRTWDEFPSLLAQADIIVSSTSAPGYVVTFEQFAHVKRQRHGRNLFLVDLAVPRDIDPRVGELDGVFLYNVDDLSQVADAAVADRRREAEKAIAIVGEETDHFLSRAHAERITPTLVALRDHFRATLSSELEHSLRGHTTLEPAHKDAVERALGAAVEKMLHAPTERLRSWAKDEHFGDWHTDLLVAAVEELFELRSERASMHGRESKAGAAPAQPKREKA